MDTIIEMNGMIDSWGYQLSNLRYQLKKNADKAVTVRVNSYGGDVNQAMMMSQAMTDHGNVTARLLGFNASAATWMVFGAKRVEIADDGLWFCHRSTMTVDILKDMNVNDLESVIADLESQKKSQEAIDLMIAQKYVSFAQSRGKKMDIESAIALMNEERWLPADEVVGLGLADGIIKGAKSVTKDAYEFAVSNCASLHLPSLPEREERKNLVERLKDFIFGEDKPAENKEEEEQVMEEILSDDHAAEEEKEPEITDNKPEMIMNKEFVTLNALLNVEGFEVADEKVSMEESQLQSIEDALKEAEAAKASLTEALDLLDSVSDSVKSIDGLKNKVLALKAIVDRVPMASPADAGKVAPAENEEEKTLRELNDLAVDPVNAEARSFR